MYVQFSNFSKRTQRAKKLGRASLRTRQTSPVNPFLTKARTRPQFQQEVENIENAYMSTPIFQPAPQCAKPRTQTVEHNPPSTQSTHVRNILNPIPFGAEAQKVEDAHTSTQTSYPSHRCAQTQTQNVTNNSAESTSAEQQDLYVTITNPSHQCAQSQTQTVKNNSAESTCAEQRDLYVAITNPSHQCAQSQTQTVTKNSAEATCAEQRDLYVANADQFLRCAQTQTQTATNYNAESTCAEQRDLYVADTNQFHQCAQPQTQIVENNISNRKYAAPELRDAVAANTIPYCSEAQPQTQTTVTNDSPNPDNIFAIFPTIDDTNSPPKIDTEKQDRYSLLLQTGDPNETPLIHGGGTLRIEEFWGSFLHKGKQTSASGIKKQDTCLTGP